MVQNLVGKRTMQLTESIGHAQSLDKDGNEKAEFVHFDIV
jgi:hypothetical protein